MYGNARGGDVAYSRVQLRFGKNEALYRSVNDSIAEINKGSVTGSNSIANGCASALTRTARLESP
jgi:hypothetical protein